MPIRPELRWLYPIDWPQISHWVRFVRAKGRCQFCGRSHGEIVHHLGDGRWWDEAQQIWRDGRGRRPPRLPRMCRFGRPRSCWRQHISITTRPTVDAGIATSGRSASGVTCCMTGQSIGAAGPDDAPPATGPGRPVLRSLPVLLRSHRPSPRLDHIRRGGFVDHDRLGRALSTLASIRCVIGTPMLAKWPQGVLLTRQHIHMWARAHANSRRC